MKLKPIVSIMYLLFLLKFTACLLAQLQNSVTRRARTLSFYSPIPVPRAKALSTKMENATLQIGHSLRHDRYIRKKMIRRTVHATSTKYKGIFGFGTCEGVRFGIQVCFRVAQNERGESEKTKPTKHKRKQKKRERTKNKTTKKKKNQKNLANTPNNNNNNNNNNNMSNNASNNNSNNKNITITIPTIIIIIIIIIIVPHI